MECLVWPKLVVLGSPGVEATLLGPAGGLRRPGALGLERAMRPLMPAVLLRRGRLGEIGQNPEAEPPHREGRQPPEGLRGERHPVVGADPRGEAVLFKGADKDRTALGALRAGQRLAAQEQSAVAIGQRQRIAGLAIAELELAFEVRGSDGIGRVHRGLRPTGMPRAADPAGRHDQPGAVEM